MNGTVEHVLKHSILYSYVLSQQFTTLGTAPFDVNKDITAGEQPTYQFHGETIRSLQKKRSQMNYPVAVKEIKEMAAATEQIIPKIQDGHHLEVERTAERKTLSEMIESEKRIWLKRLMKSAALIEPGISRNEHVQNVQEALHYMGYFEDNVDGIYGPLTYAALIRAEEGLNLKLTTANAKEDLDALYSKKSAAKPTGNVHKAEVKSSNADVIQSARALLGTPYMYGGTSPSGFDCSGFIQYVYSNQKITIPRTVRDMWNFSRPVDVPSVGDIVFFNTNNTGPSHAGIYIGNSKFIHSGSSRGVEISEMNNVYWKERYLGAKRI
ncbi:C40 family peptidase [Oceanobacillus massiliensis]|uniref:C40 family peptidase n=1 Tax=Oceanobacillus massiliensis TaxID=1465765 RepID=UPI0002898B94|nr:NlpC/P60 family protein [Oceanobacillus massiliensis]